MEEMNIKTNSNDVEAYKTKYGKVYQVGITIEPDDSTTIELEYIFRKPSTPSYDRYIKTASQSPSKALRAFIMDNVIDEQIQKLDADLEEYPALTISLGEKLLNMLGLSKDINLKLL